MDQYPNDTKVVKGIESPSNYPASEIHIKFPDQSPYANDMILYATHDYIDAYCHKLSAAMPEAQVRISQGCCWRIEYKAGVRIRVQSMQEFYSNIDDESNKSYLVLNSKYRYDDPDQPHYI